MTFSLLQSDTFTQPESVGQSSSMTFSLLQSDTFTQPESVGQSSSMTFSLLQSDTFTQPESVGQSSSMTFSLLQSDTFTQPESVGQSSSMPETGPVLLSHSYTDSSALSEQGSPEHKKPSVITSRCVFLSHISFRKERLFVVVGVSEK